MSDDIMANVTWYREGIRIVVDRSVAFTGWSAASIRCALVTSAYVPSQTHTSYANIVAFEVSGGDYLVGGLVLAGKTIATVTNQLRLDAVDAAWSNILVKPRYAVVYDATNALSTQRTLLGYTDLGNVKSRKLRIRWPSQGVLVLTVEDAPGFP